MHFHNSEVQLFEVQHVCYIIIYVMHDWMFTRTIVFDV